jgi:hypothetical protein
LQIDDDDKSEQDDEEVEMLAATGAGEASGKADEKQQQTAKKSVRMAEDVPDGECTYLCQLHAKGQKATLQGRQPNCNHKQVQTCLAM